MKYHIKKNSVQETLIIPLYRRKMCSELYPNLFCEYTLASGGPYCDCGYKKKAK